MISSYPEAIDFLYGLRMFGAQLGLEKPARLAALCGDPQRQLRFVHVAGTNGKGSTCAFLESIYRASGLRVGLFTSPHLVAFGERIQVNRRLIPEGEVVRSVKRLQSLLPEFSAADHPTFFEIVTVMALLHFVEQRCDLVIWETGMGGRLDATNIVTPIASVITTVDLDHQQWLGNSLVEVAREKAGIIKPGVPVVTAPGHPEALAVIRETARERQAPLTEVSRQEIDAPPLDRVRLPLLGEHQRLNAAVAVATVRTLSAQFPVSEDTLAAGLRQAEWPGRLQVVPLRHGQTLLLDGAHNTSGAVTLRAALEKYFPETRRTLILGLLADKDVEAICRLLAPGFARILTVPVESKRTASPEQVAEFCRSVQLGVEIRACNSLPEAWEQAKNDPFIVLTGSLHLIGQAMELLKISLHPGERALNEWSTAPAADPTR